MNESTFKSRKSLVKHKGGYHVTTYVLSSVVWNTKKAMNTVELPNDMFISMVKFCLMSLCENLDPQFLITVHKHPKYTATAMPSNR
jgi:hypothetical protein